MSEDSSHPVEIARSIAQQMAEATGREVDHESFDRAKVELDGIYIELKIQVTAEHIKKSTTGLDDKQVEKFLEQLEPRLALVLEKETEEYVQFALKHFSEEQNAAPTEVQGYLIPEEIREAFDNDGSNGGGGSQSG